MITMASASTNLVVADAILITILANYISVALVAM